MQRHHLISMTGSFKSILDSTYNIITKNPRVKERFDLPYLFRCDPDEWPGGDRGFRFEAWWLKEDGCSEQVQAAWEEGCMEEHGGVSTGLRNVARRMTKWGKEVVGELEERLKQARRDLETTMRAPVSEAKVREEAKLRCQVEKLEERKNIKARQRSHVSFVEGWQQKHTLLYGCGIREEESKQGDEVEKGGWYGGEGGRGS